MKIINVLLFTFCCFVVKLNAQSTNQNYILSTQYLENILVDDNFTSSIGNWQENGNVTTSLINGKVRVNINSSREGLKNPLKGFNTIQGKTLSIKINFNKGNTDSNVRLYLEERNPAGGLVGNRMINDNLQTGVNQYSYIMTASGNFMIFRIDKDNTNTSTNSFFELDYISLQIDDNTSIEKLENITYLDGFGRPKQFIGIKQTPNQKDIVQHVEYDQFGRRNKQYLALPSSQSTGNFLSNSKTLTEHYYQIAFADQHPFSEVRYDNSPLNRELENTGPGNTWQILHNSDNDHTIKKDYGLNVYEEVHRFIINNNNKPFDITFYSPNTLIKKIIKNENWTPGDGKLNTTEVFTDKNDKMIAEFNFEAEEGSIKILKKYYVYDISGNLRYVLPPKLTEQLQSVSIDDYYDLWLENDFLEQGDAGTLPIRFSVSNTFGNIINFTALRSNLSIGLVNKVLKKQTVKTLNTSSPIPDMELGEVRGITAFSAPGGGPLPIPVGIAKIENGNLVVDRISTVPFHTISIGISVNLNRIPLNQLQLDNLAFQYKYDQFNRQIAQKVPGKGWEYMVYDQLDRPVLTQDANLKLQNKWLFNKYDVYGRLVYNGLHTNKASRDQLQNQINNFIDNSTKKDNAETRTNSAITTGDVAINYTNSAFPINNLEVLKVNYYDDYNFSDPHMPNITTNILNHNVTTRLKGLQTASWTKTLGATSWSKDYNIYDEKGRVISVYNRNYLGGFTENKSDLDFRGKVLKSITTHKKMPSSPNLSIEDTYEYDHAERPTSHFQKINKQRKELIAYNSYNELGQIISKNIGGINKKTGLQKADYTYNIRGWLENMNNPNSLGDDLFGYKLNYTDPTQGNSNVSTPYNGYIKQTIWRSAHNGIKKSYAIEYDELDRFTRSSYRENNSLTGGIGRFETYSLRYDSNGNIKKLSRNNNMGSQVDKLGYRYDGGNRLLGINDLTNNSFGFNDTSTSGNDYSYDANGNLIMDKNKNITKITYNHLDLVESVNFGNGAKIEFVYDASGNKLLMRNLFSKSIRSVTHYLNGFQYEGDQLQFFPTPEGYVVKNGAVHQYVYVLSDHLGNNRVSFMDYNDDLNISSNEILSNTDYYVMGLTHQGENISGIASNYNYKYQGKEKLDYEHYNMYDFGSRMYDPTVGRWFNTDPQNQYLSPYLAMGNNGVMMIDPDGELAFLIPLAIGIAKAAKAVKVAKFAKASFKAMKLKIKLAKAFAPSSSLASATAGKIPSSILAKKSFTAGLKSGALNTMASYKPGDNFGDFAKSFGAGFIGGATGVGADSKLLGAVAGGTANWEFNGRKGGYEGAQYFVGGALSSYQGLSKVKGKKLFKNAKSSTLKNHGDNFIKYGLQNTAYDFAYSKQEDFAKRGWNHLTGFAWGGLTGAYQSANFEKKAFANSLFYQGVIWVGNGAIKKNFEEIKYNGSQLNKGFISYAKWMNDIWKM